VVEILNFKKGVINIRLNAAETYLMPGKFLCSTAGKIRTLNTYT
jgi:hypothetical protein